MNQIQNNINNNDLGNNINNNMNMNNMNLNNANNNQNNNLNINMNMNNINMNNINLNNANNNQNNNINNNTNMNNMNNNMFNNMNINNLNNNMIPNNMANNMNMNNLNNNMNNNMINSNQNYGYAKVAIQALDALNYFKFKLFLDYNTKQKEIKNFTNSFKFLFSALFTNINEQYFTKVMNVYNQSNLNNNTSNIQNPYSFLLNILQILKKENQIAIMQQNEQNMSFQDWMNKRYNVEKCFKLYRHNINHFEKSFISDCLYYTQYEIYVCNQCGQYCHFSLLPMIEIDLDKFSIEGAPKYAIKTYLETYFSKQFPTVCSVCRNQSNVQYKMFSNTPILIIHFYRNDLTKPNKTEINLDFNLNIKDCLFKYPEIYPYEEFVLKGYISYDEQIGYFIDYNFKIDNDNFIWIRYNNDNYTQINNQYINNCKPILVFYESKSEKRPEPPKPKKNQININQSMQNHNFAPNSNNNQVLLNQNNPNINNVGNMMNMTNNFQRNNNFGVNNYNMMGTGQINPMMPVNTMNPQNMMQMQQQQMQQTMQQQMQQQMQHQMQMQMIQQSQMQMQQHINMLNQQQLMNKANQILNPDNTNQSNNEVNSGNQNNADQNNINIIVHVVPESNMNDDQNKITMQIRKDEKINEIYQRLLCKLVTEDQNYIKKIIFNNNEISKTSTQKASEVNFTHNCKVIAVKNEAAAN